MTKPVNIGVIGAGYWGKKIVSEYLTLSKDDANVSLLSVCDVYEKNLRLCGEAFQISKNRLAKTEGTDHTSVYVRTPRRRIVTLPTAVPDAFSM